MKKKIMLSLAALALAAGTCQAAGNPYAGKFFASGDPKKAEFALTFDDGPGFITGDLLILLEKRGVKATFFMLGASARARPGLAGQVREAGHLVANHTDSHKNWFEIGEKADREAVLAAELGKAAASIEKASGVRTTVLRMPNGYDRPWVREAARRLGYTLVNWTYGSDWLKQSDGKLAAEYLKAVRPGAILLLHDGGGKNRARNLPVVEAVLDEAAKKGLKAVRLDDLLGLRPPGPKP
ncbi:MAG: polysaccharide deacetylase family protein [Elusimicrobia bacterium]|nr:polysaccharide deacetylase family protein [Elusimicrobiota bacterium]